MKLGYHYRVGAEFAASRYQSSYVTVVGDGGDRLWLSPYEARVISRLLKKAADAVDPPKKRARS